MSETTETTETTTDPTTEPQGAEVEAEAAPSEAAQPATDWKAEARKWEALAKKNKDAATQLAEIEEASKTEAQRQADALAAAEAKVKEYETREQIASWKAEVSTETGVPAAALAGSTKEEIEAHAETLKPLINPDPAASPVAAAVPTVGQQPATPGNVPLKDQIAAAEAAGDKGLVASLKAQQLGSS